MLNYNQIVQRKYIIVDDEPYEVIENSVAQKNRGKPSNQTKIKNLITGSVVSKTFHASDKVHEAELERRDIKYLYQKRDEIWFSDPNNPRDRFQLDGAIIEESLPYLKENDVIRGIYFDDQLISVKIPIKVDLVVTEAADAVKGNTSSGATKRVTLENGLELFVPLFIKQGDTVVVNTEKGEYVERKSS